MKIKNLIRSMGVGLALFAGPLLQDAAAGPVFTFGPEDQGQLKLDYKGQFQLRARDEGGGTDGDDSAMEFNFRRNRLALMGSYGPNFGLYVQTEFNEDNNIDPLTVDDGDESDFQILDAVFRFKLDERANVWVGKFKYNFTRENLEACEMPLTLDRSLLIRAPFVTTRDKGVALWGNVLDGKLQYRADVMNGRNDSDSAPDSNFRYSVRGHVSLLEPEKDYGYKGTYLGKKKVLTVGAAYQMEKDVAYADEAGAADAVDYQAWTADLFFEYPTAGAGTFTASTAYVDYDLDDAYQGSDPDSGAIGVNGEKNGYYVKAGYLLPTLPLQLFGRFENWSFAQLDGIYDQEVDWYGAGLNYYLRGQDLKLSLEYSVTDYDQESAAAEDFKTLVAQLQVLF